LDVSKLGILVPLQTAKRQVKVYLHPAFYSFNV